MVVIDVLLPGGILLHEVCSLSSQSSLLSLRALQFLLYLGKRLL